MTENLIKDLVEQVNLTQEKLKEGWGRLQQNGDDPNSLFHRHLLPGDFHYETIDQWEQVNLTGRD